MIFPPILAKRFRGYFPVIIDIETGGFNSKIHPLLEIAAITTKFDEEGLLQPDRVIHEHIIPFEGSECDPKALEFTGIDPFHPFRLAKNEEVALNEMFKIIRQEQKNAHCRRSVLVGHNAAFDLNFLNQAVQRNQLKRNPFHPFTTFDTASLSALCFGQTVLARAAAAANIQWDATQAHSAIYDARQTAILFCHIVNRWHFLNQLDI